MTPKRPELSPKAFEKLREQLATAAALCSDDQLLVLADGLHDARRRRREARHAETRSWNPPAQALSAAH